MCNSPFEMHVLKYVLKYRACFGLLELDALLLHLHCANLAGQTEEVDEALCVMMVIKVTGSKGSDALIVK